MSPRLQSRKTAPSFIDLCCGCGGFSSGLIAAGLSHVAGYDIDKTAIATYNLNFPGTGIAESIEELELEAGAADVICAGLPCQGFSTLGKLDDKDPRNRLWKHFVRVVKQVNPVAGAVENVPPFLKSTECALLTAALQECGYKVVSGVVKATSFGVAQKRERALLIFSRVGRPRIPRGRSKVRSVRDALRGLPTKPDGVRDHNPRNHGKKALERFPHVRQGESRFQLPDHLQNDCWREMEHGATNSFGRLWWDKPADTLRTVFLKPETGRFIHPSEHRGLTVREGARLQSFPDDFVFSGNMEEKARQIGNAVPPLVAKAVGRELARLVAMSRADVPTRMGQATVISAAAARKKRTA